MNSLRPFLLLAAGALAGCATTSEHARILAWRPQTPVAVDEDQAGQLVKLIDTLEEDDDVQTVWGNYDIPDEVMERLG